MSLQSCLFGVGLVELQLADNISLFGNGSYEEVAIYYSDEENNCSAILVPSTVFAVGYDDSFIIAKSQPIDWEQSTKKTYYHIIEIKKLSCENKDSVPYYTLEQFNFLKKKLNISKDLNFTINFEDKLTNVKKTVNSY